MKTKNDKSLLLSLIKDDLTNCKLVNGLNKLGLNSDHYHLNLSDTIFELIGFKDEAYDEEVYRYYLKLSSKVNKLDISKSNEPLEILALHIYEELLRKKQVM